MWLDPLEPDEEDEAHEGDGKCDFDRDAPPRVVVVWDGLDVEFKTGWGGGVFEHVCSLLQSEAPLGPKGKGPSGEIGRFGRAA